jgi:alpha-beta hydrolase superfamily lysophospholipase
MGMGKQGKKDQEHRKETCVVG